MKHFDSLTQLTTLAVMVLLNGCSVSSPTPTPYPTQTPYSTATPYPTSTPLPTATATATPTSTPTPSNIVELYDFENQATPVPSGMAADLGTLITDAPNEVWNKYEIDTSTSHAGTKSLKFTGDINTTRWYKFARQIPTNYDQVSVSYYARGNNLRKEGKQFDTCYVGFALTDSSGKNEWPGNEYGSTFDWRYGEQRLSSSQMRSVRDNGSKIQFRIACFKSGEFWIDDLKFEFSPLVSPVTPTAGSPASGAPVIESVNLRNDSSSGSLIIYQDIFFRDPDGDAITTQIEIVSQTISGLTASGGPINVPSQQQKQGATTTGTWRCGNGVYSVTLRITILDKADNRSNPFEYTMNCR